MHRVEPGLLEDPEGGRQRQTARRDEREPEQLGIPAYELEARTHECCPVPETHGHGRLDRPAERSRAAPKGCASQRRADNRRVDERWVDLDDTRLFLRTWGEPDAKPMLFWHGVSLTARASLVLNEAGPLFCPAQPVGSCSRRTRLRTGASARAPALPPLCARRPRAPVAGHARRRPRRVHGLLVGRRRRSSRRRQAS